MAKGNKKSNDLAGDDDTSELQALTWRRDRRSASETEQVTASFERSCRTAVQATDSAEMDELRYELEQQTALLRGVRAESATRQSIIDRLHAQVEELEAEATKLRKQRRKARARSKRATAAEQSLLSEKQQLEALLADKDERIGCLEAGNETLHEQIAGLETKLGERDGMIAKLRQDLEASDAAGNPAVTDSLQQIHRYEIAKLEQRLKRSESLADELRQSLQDRIADDEQARQTVDSLRKALDESTAENAALAEGLERAEAALANLESSISLIAGRHSEELQRLQEELQTAKDETSQQQLINDELTSDLLNTRSFKRDLEDILTANEERSQEEIRALERRLAAAEKEAADLKRQLDDKNEAVNSLLAELTSRRSSDAGEYDGGETVAALDHVEVSFSNTVGGSRWRRYLIGEVDGQEVQFPLFKGRVTIGRTENNDIQLPANYISRRHAVIVTDGDVARIVDWGSRNGVAVNGHRVTEHFLRSGDTVRIGTFDFVFEEKPKTES